MKKNKLRKFIAGIIVFSIFTLNITGCSITPVADNNEAFVLPESDIITEVSSGNPEAEAYEETVSENDMEQIEETVSEGDLEAITEPESVSSGNIALKDERVRVKGIYVTGPVAGNSRFNELVNLVDETSLNTMVIDVKNDEGRVTFKMDAESVAESGACYEYIKDIDSFMANLKEHNIYTIARIVCFRDTVLCKAHPEYALKKTNGAAVTDNGNADWLNPYNHEVWDYIIDIAKEAANAGFDEIQFDYVRFPMDKEANYGEAAKAVSKVDNITEFLTYAAESLNEDGIILGADLFGTVIASEIDTNSTGQDYDVLGGIVNVLCPMVYPSHYANGSFGLTVPDAKPYETIYGAMCKSVEALSVVPEENRAIVRPYIQCFTASWVKGHITYGLNEVNAQIKGLEDAGYEEWILWNASNKYEGKIK